MSAASCSSPGSRCGRPSPSAATSGRAPPSWRRCTTRRTRNAILPIRSWPRSWSSRRRPRPHETARADGIMLFRRHKPGYPLSRLVEDFWIYDGYAAAHRRERILPSGTFEIVFNLREDELRIYDPGEPARCRRFSGAVVSGPYSTCFMSDTQEEASITGVHFRPGGALPFLGRPAGEHGDAHIDLRLIYGPSVGELRERLCAARTATIRFRLLEAFLVRHLADPPPCHGAVGVSLRLIVATR